MKLSVSVGTSLDGFIARRNGKYDFLPAGGGEPLFGPRSLPSKNGWRV